MNLSEEIGLGTITQDVRPDFKCDVLYYGAMKNINTVEILSCCIFRGGGGTAPLLPVEHGTE